MKQNKGREFPALFDKWGDFMTDISKEILKKYQIRKTKKQKTEFIEFLRAHFPELKVERGGFPGNRNIVIGDADTAKAVLTAHYDTCAVMPIPNFIMPKKRMVSLLYSLVLVVPMVLIAVGVINGVDALTDNRALVSSAGMLVYWLLLGLLMFGPANKHTVNDNTSGVITLVELMTAMAEEERAQTCFVFFDNEEKGLLGSAAFAKKHKEVMKNKLLINYDCVSDGDSIMLVCTKNVMEEYSEHINASFVPPEGKAVLIEEAKKTHYPSDQKNFKKCIGTAAFKKSKFGLYMDRIHTPKDTVMDERNIDFIVSSTIKFIEKI